MKPIVAIIVLYQMSIGESPTCRTLIHALQTDPRFAEAIHLIVADNSLLPQPVPPDFPGLYIHDQENPGLARRYNQALAMAVAEQAQWLLLFDQDTQPTSAYLEELLALSTSLQNDPHVAVIVPKLRMHGRILSPHAPRFVNDRDEVTLATYGIASPNLRAFNSAALVRVSSLLAINGFPATYWLDYLDHATFHRIQQRSGRIFVMHAILEHELSDARGDRTQNPDRLLNRLQAEERFYTEHGSAAEHFLHRLDLMRQILGWGRRGNLHQARIRLKVLLHFV